MLWRSGLILLLLLTLFSATTAQEPEPIRIWISDSMPTDLLNWLNPLFASGEYQWVTDLDAADLALDFERPGGAVTTKWLYVPVVPFASVEEQIFWSDVRRYWQGDPGALSYLTPDGSPPIFVVSNETLRAMVSLLGMPHESVPLRYAQTTDAIAPLLWETRPYSWGIVSFNHLTPDLKVLTMDRASVFGTDFEMDAYPLTTQIHLKGDQQQLGAAMDDLIRLGTWQASNRDSAQLARVVVSGVTALSRATAYQMELQGVTAPAAGIMPFLADAELIHTSNEVSFSENCPEPDPYGGVVFCSQDEYFELLTHIGVNVMEQTGNHVNDYGPGPMRRSLEMYEKAGMGIFGGGYDPEDARDAYIVEVNGTSIAFIGCNIPGPFGAWASESRAGAAQCDDAFLEAEIPRLAAEVDVVILTFQEYEYYRYEVSAPQLTRFKKYAALGADVILGTQAHQPHGFTIENGVFMHHGLGNLFFDQMANITTRQMFMDKLIVYDGRVISVVLFTGIIEDYCCPRPMTAVEREAFLTDIYDASGW